MTITALLILVLSLLVTAGFVAYAVATLKGDGQRFGRPQPPASHYRDLFDPRIGAGPGTTRHA